MSSDKGYTICPKSGLKIDNDALPFYNYEYEMKIKKVEEALQLVIDENSRLKTQNDELQKSVLSITEEIKSSFSQVAGIVDGLKKKAEEKEKKKEETNKEKETEK